MSLTAAVKELLGQVSKPLPLTRQALQPQVRLHLSDADKLFPGAPSPEAALAGLALQLGDWEGAHQIAQDLATREGSYWHAIIHRMEPDYGNAGYWFRRVGLHPVFAEIAVSAQRILADNPVNGWTVSSVWNPAQFADWTRQAVESRDSRQDKVARIIQEIEFQYLFDFCAQNPNSP